MQPKKPKITEEDIVDTPRPLNPTVKITGDEDIDENLYFSTHALSQM